MLPQGNGVQDSEKVAVKRVYKTSEQINQRGKDADWKRATQLFESGELYEAKVEGANNGGLIVRLGSLLGFIPFSQLANTLKDRPNLTGLATSLVGKTITTKVRVLLLSFSYESAACCATLQEVGQCFLMEKEGALRACA